MPEDPTPDDDHATDDGPVITSLRKDREDAKAEALAAKRELALHKAGLGDLTEKQMNALIGAHGNDEWNSDALKATAAEINLVKPAEGAPEPHIPVAEQEAHQRVAAASGGPPAATPDLDAAIAAANSPEELKEVLRQAGRLAVSE